MEASNPIDFIKDLKSQHKSIISTISDIDNQDGGASNILASTEKLSKITELLFNHLEKEDKQLYPILINNKETQDIGKKYFYDMERLSCMSIDFFKKYCTQNENKKIFAEDFINAYSLFKGLLKVRIKREELELYPAFILLQSGILHSETVSYMNEQEQKTIINRKNVIVYGKGQPVLDALTLALEMEGHKAIATHNENRISSTAESELLDLVLIDLNDKSKKELIDLVTNLRTHLKTGTQIVGFSGIPSKEKESEDKLSIKFDSFINNVTTDLEGFSTSVSQLLAKIKK